MWAIPGGFKRPTETLDEAAVRELREETGVDAASLLTQFGAYGDPERDPRMNVVTIAYLAVLRDVRNIAGGSDAAAAALLPVTDVLSGKVELAFDHERIVRDALERVRVELEVTGIATAFVGQTFTLAELRAVYEAVWDVQLDAANFRRSVVAEEGWVIPTGRRAAAGIGGRKARGALPAREGVASRRPDPSHPTSKRTELTHASRRHRSVRPTGGAPPRGGGATRSEGRRGARSRSSRRRVTRSDCGFRAASPFFSRAFTGIRRPRRRIVGSEFAGVVEAIGRGRVGARGR